MQTGQRTETDSVVPRLWSVEDYQRLGELGVFLPEERVELIEGVIFDVPPHLPPHGRAIMRGNSTLVELCGKTHYVRVQLALQLGPKSMPEPDFALVRREVVDSSEGHPTGADLVIEVSESSLGHDRRKKAGLYARAGIPEYWIINLRDRLVEVYREPGPMPDGAFGHGYHLQRAVAWDARLSPLFRPDVEVELGTFF